MPISHPLTEVESPAFQTTHWSVVLAARQEESPRTHEALEALCRTYWFPLYAYIRRKGYGAEDAQDLTQEFFARMLRLNSLTSVQREKGRFRSFLLASLHHFLADAWDPISLKWPVPERQNHDRI